MSEIPAPVVPGVKLLTGRVTAARAIGTAMVAIVTANIALTLPSALPGALQQGLHATGGQITWYSALFGVATALSGLSFAVLGDRWGRKRVLLIGFGLVTAGSVIALLAGSIHVLWVAQIVAGLGGGALYTSSLAIIIVASVTPASRARAIALWSVALAAGTGLGPLLAGAMARNGSWRAAYVPVMVIAVIAALACAWLAPESRATAHRSFDWGGQVLIALFVVGVCYGSIQGSEQGWTSGPALGGFAVAAVALAAFLAVEWRQQEPLLRLQLFRIPAFSSAAFVAVVGMASFVAVIYMISLLFGVADHLNSLQIGLRLLPNSLVTVVAYPLLRRWLARVSARWLLGLGVLPLAAGEFWLAAQPVNASYGAVLGPMLLIGVGFAFLVSSLTTGAVNSVPIQLGSRAAGTTETLRLIGQTLAISVLGAIGLSRAGTYLAGRLAGAGLPPAGLHVAEGVAAQGGVVAVASAPLGPISHVVAPLATSALGAGLDYAMRVSAIAVLVAAAVVLIFLRDDPGRLILHDTEEETVPAETSAGTVLG